MSTALVRCPNCGSVSNRTNVPDEYICSHCKARFKFVRPGDQVVTHDVRTHTCPVCGGSVEAGKGIRCVRCGRNDVCTNCARKTPEGHVCRACLKQSQDDCIYCGDYAMFKCASCMKSRPSNPNRACVVHGSSLFWFDAWGFWTWHDETGCWFYCPTCHGWVCKDCIEPKKEAGLSTKTYYVCRTCKTRLLEENRGYPEMITAAVRARGGSTSSMPPVGLMKKMVKCPNCGHEYYPRVSKSPCVCPSCNTPQPDIDPYSMG
jgi:hypothetical protein